MPTILTDNFNSYADGDLNTQGSWSGSVIFDIQGTVVREGAKAVSAAAIGSDQNITKTGTATATGKISFYVRRTATGGGATRLALKTGATLCHEVVLQATGAVDMWDSSSGSWKNLGTYVADTWYLIEIEWQDSDDKARGRLDGGSWTVWCGTQAAFSSLDTVELKVYVGMTGTVYYDYIAQDPVDISITETISLVEVKSLTTFWRQTLQEVLTLAEQSVSITKSFTITLTETLKLNEIIRISAKIWSWVAKNTSSWTNQSKSSAPSWSHQSKNTSSWTWENKEE